MQSAPMLTGYESMEFPLLVALCDTESLPNDPHGTRAEQQI